MLHIRHCYSILQMLIGRFVIMSNWTLAISLKIAAGNFVQIIIILVGIRRQ